MSNCWIFANAFDNKMTYYYSPAVLGFFSLIHGVLLLSGFSPGSAGGRLCPLHQPVPRLRAADPDGAPVVFLLPTGNHGRIQRSVPFFYVMLRTFSHTFQLDFVGLCVMRVCVLLCFAQKCPELRMNCRGLRRS